MAKANTHGGPAHAASAERTIAITGGGAGIGRGIAMHFHGLGWRVAALDRDRDALDELAGALPEERFLPLACDVGAEDQVRKAFAGLEDWLESAGLDCLVNNAGIADPYCGPLEDLALADWQRWIDASLTAAFLCSRASVTLLRQAAAAGRSASVVNMSSTRAVMSEPECFAYAAAKGGLDALTHALAVSLGPQIRVNALRPGWIETGPWQKAADRSEPDHSARDRAQHPVGRVGRVEDIAEAVAWLADAGFVTGQHINVDGGMSVKMIYAD
ncbi:MAG: SDR family oxidoreductase [Sphingomonadales bacterium]|nr:SDR family oxidoreductase [Sphingomonadales bacterium]MBD3774213.1 SDR family oxidoreductase [Paracoccaceae bacterium]